MNEIKFGREWVSVEPTTTAEAAKRAEIIDEIYKLTGVSKGTIRDVMAAFVDVANREMLMRGVFQWQGLPSVTRAKVKKRVQYYKDINKTLLFPESAYLVAKMHHPIRRKLREIYKEQMKLEHGITDEKWYTPFVVGDGDLTKEVREKIRNGEM